MPNKYACLGRINLFSRQLDEDTKALSELKFDDLPSEDEWMALGSENLD